MAAVDSLLKLAQFQGADELTIVSDDVPSLVKAGVLKKLTMPPVSKDLVILFIEEITGPREDAATDNRKARGVYKTQEGAVFKYEVERQDDICRLTFRVDNRSVNARDDSHPPPDETIPSAEPLDTPREEHQTDADSFIGLQEKGAVHVERAASIPPVLTAFIERALQEGASDIFFSTGDYPRMRVRGEIDILHGTAVDEEHLLAVAGADLTQEQSAALKNNGSVDLAASLQIGGLARRFRVSLFSHLHGLAAALRPIRNRIPSLKELNLPVSLREICGYPNGLVLVTGASGAGKSTTLAALLDHINQTRACHIITLEDPIEFEYVNQRALIHQRELHRHMDAFSTGLVAALRESPDVILLGEMRDPATVAAALTAAETGHLVLSTLHTGDAASAIDRIIDVFPGHRQTQVRHQLASVLRVVLTQYLVPATVPEGRVPAIEKLVVTNGAACSIREGRSHQIAGLIQAGGQDGMITLERSLADLVNNRLISMKTALAYARDEESLRQLTGTKR